MRRIARPQMRRAGGIAITVAIALALFAGSAMADLGLELSPPPITVGAYPISSALAPDGSRLYVVNSNPFSNPREASLSVIDTSSRQVIQTFALGTGYSAEQMAVTPDGTRAYVANASHVDAVDLTTGHVVVIEAGSLMSGIVIARDGKRAYVTDRNLNRVVVIDTDPLSASFHGVIPSAMFTSFQPYGIGITPDGSRVYVTGGHVAIPADGSRVYVVSSGPLAVDVFSTVTNSRTTIPLSTSPSEVAIVDPGSNQQVDALDVQDGVVVGVVMGAAGTVVLAVRPTNKLVVMDANPASATYNTVLGSVAIDQIEPDGIAYRGTPDAFAYALNGGQDPGIVSIVVATAPIPYTFSGFFSPVDNPPVVNTVNAGQAIPVKWQLTLNNVPVSDPSSFVSLTSYNVNCGTLIMNPESTIDEYAAGSSGLRSLGNGNWQFNWKTSKNYANTCRIIVLTLSDGSTHTADFKFK